MINKVWLPTHLKRTYILLFLCSRDSLPGHGFPTRLHAFSSVLFPIHAEPPYCAFILIVRVLLYVPVPQTPAHSVSSGQSPQSFQMQSTKYQFWILERKFQHAFDNLMHYCISLSIPGHDFSRHGFSWYPDPTHSSPKGLSLLSCIFNLTLLRFPSPHVALQGDQVSSHSAHKQFTAMHLLIYRMRDRGKLSNEITQTVKKGFDTKITSCVIARYIHIAILNHNIVADTSLPSIFGRNTDFSRFCLSTSSTAVWTIWPLCPIAPSTVYRF